MINNDCNQSQLAMINVHKSSYTKMSILFFPVYFILDQKDKQQQVNVLVSHLFISVTRPNEILK